MIDKNNHPYKAITPLQRKILTTVLTTEGWPEDKIPETLQAIDTITVCCTQVVAADVLEFILENK
jgi:hypothetical protein